MKQFSLDNYNISIFIFCVTLYTFQLLFNIMAFVTRICCMFNYIEYYRIIEMHFLNGFKQIIRV